MDQKNLFSPPSQVVEHLACRPKKGGDEITTVPPPPSVHCRPPVKPSTVIPTDTEVLSPYLEKSPTSPTPRHPTSPLKTKLIFEVP